MNNRIINGFVSIVNNIIDAYCQKHPNEYEFDKMSIGYNEEDGEISSANGDAVGDVLDWVNGDLLMDLVVNPVVYVVIMNHSDDVVSSVTNTMVFRTLAQAKEALKNAYDKFVEKNYEEDGTGYNMKDFAESGMSSSVYRDGDYVNCHYDLEIFERRVL